MPATETLIDPADEPPRILIVEDEWLIRSVAAEVLREMGAEVIEAQDAEEALTWLASGAPVDLVFSDNRMPGQMSGAELARAIGERWPTVKVVMTSALDVAGWSGDMVPKPYDLERIATELVRLALKGRQSGG
jgi:CheY-like chemotaxis protein